jgi:predicted PurR-regulated permease PerM
MRDLPEGHDAALKKSDGLARLRAGILIALLATGILIGIRNYIPGLLGAAILYVVGAPVYRRLLRRFRASFAALIVTLGMATLFVLPVIWLGALALAEAPGALERAVNSDTFHQLAALQVGSFDVGAQFSQMGELLATWASSQAFALVGSVTRGVLNLFIAAVGLYFLLISADDLWKRVRPLIPFSQSGAEALRERFGLVTEATLLGMAATGVAQGATIGTAFWLVGLPNPVVWGAATAVASIFPIVGSGLVWGPGVLILVASASYGRAAVLAVIGIVIASNIDNVIRPLVYRRVSGVHPLATLVGAFAGVEVIGIVGLLMGPLAISYLFELLRLYEVEFARPATAA